MLKANALISVIVPIYNTERFVPACIDSILNQTYGNLEIILVDDGSTDRSRAIADEYALLDSRVKVIHQDNAGASAARNAGIRQAKGSWVSFIDSDDTIEPDYYEKILDCALNTGAEISFGISFIMDEDGRRINGVREYIHEASFNHDDGLYHLLKSDVFGIAVNKLYKKDLVHKGFDENIRINEDLMFNWECFSMAKRSTFVGKPLYNYRIRTGSASRSGFGRKQADTVTVMEEITKRSVQTYGKASAITRCAQSRYVGNVVSAIRGGGINRR